MNSNYRIAVTLYSLETWLLQVYDDNDGGGGDDDDDDGGDDTKHIAV